MKLDTYKSCTDCGDRYKLIIGKHPGRADLCRDCNRGFEDVPKVLGYNDGSLNKSTNISIYTGNNPETRRKISNQRARVGG